MRVMVIGGAGYIGSHICKALFQVGDEPVVLDNLSRGHRHAVHWEPLVELDVRNFTHVIDLAQAHLKALDPLKASADSFACNLGTGKDISVRQILDAVEQVIGRPVPHST